jgi:leucyl aminopeptidase (aminopeptidase T)
VLAENLRHRLLGESQGLAELGLAGHDDCDELSRSSTASQLVAVDTMVRSGRLLIDGKLVERPDTPSTPSAA